MTQPRRGHGSGEAGECVRGWLRAVAALGTSKKASWPHSGKSLVNGRLFLSPRCAPLLQLGIDIERSLGFGSDAVQLTAGAALSWRLTRQFNSITFNNCRLPFAAIDNAPGKKISERVFPQFCTRLELAVAGEFRSSLANEADLLIGQRGPALLRRYSQIC